jgi:bifunctional non-homologous end joining protein LigD
MECLSAQVLPIISGWTYEIKLDGYRLQAHRLGDLVVLYSRRGNLKKFPEIAKELEQLPAGTILDGELVALDDQGRPRFNLLQGLEVLQCPFTNLPDKRPGLWGQGVTAAKMKECRWLKPTAVAEIEFAEWTPGDRLRGASFICLRDDKGARGVV